MPPSDPELAKPLSPGTARGAGWPSAAREACEFANARGLLDYDGEVSGKGIPYADWLDTVADFAARLGEASGSPVTAELRPAGAIRLSAG